MKENTYEFLIKIMYKNFTPTFFLNSFIHYQCYSSQYNVF